MNQYGTRLRLSIFGESHGEGVGIVLDGVPAGLPIDQASIQAALDTRRPGTSKLVSQRNEPDQAQILSGVYEAHATGAPLAIWIANQDARSRSYRDLARTPRPGHSDWVARVRAHGFNDHRGGGHYSGRLTAPLVAAGAVSEAMLEQDDVVVAAHLHQVHDVAGPTYAHTARAMRERVAASQVHTAHEDLEDRFATIIDDARRSKDSVGGIVEFVAEGCPVAWGDPFFQSVESHLASLFYSVPAVKGVEFGAGFASGGMFGSQHNDPYEMRGDQVRLKSNHAGGILGGLTTGAPVCGRVAIKPTSSIFQTQESVDLVEGKNTQMDLKGRHDPCIAIRAVPVVRACTAIALADFQLLARQEGIGGRT